jgi:cytoskeletal protein CcmA (bactofilin family)
MFNKPDVFARNDANSRRDAVPVLNSANPQDRNAAAVKTASAQSLTAVPPAERASSAAPVEPVPSASDNVTGARLIVGPDVKLKGAEILDCDTLVVEGRVEATMDSRLLRIAEKGSFAGKVSIDIAEIRGTFEGELTARSQLIIHSTGRVSGTVRFGKLVVEEGGELNGEISVINGKTPAQPAQAKPVVEPYVARSAASA